MPDELIGQEAYPNGPLYAPGFDRMFALIFDQCVDADPILKSCAQTVKMTSPTMMYPIIPGINRPQKAANFDSDIESTRIGKIGVLPLTSEPYINSLDYPITAFVSEIDQLIQSFLPELANSFKSEPDIQMAERLKQYADNDVLSHVDGNPYFTKEHSYWIRNVECVGNQNTIDFDDFASGGTQPTSPNPMVDMTQIASINAIFILARRLFRSMRSFGGGRQRFAGTLKSFSVICSPSREMFWQQALNVIFFSATSQVIFKGMEVEVIGSPWLVNANGSETDDIFIMFNGSPGMKAFLHGVFVPIYTLKPIPLESKPLYWRQTILNSFGLSDADFTTCIYVNSTSHSLLQQGALNGVLRGKRPPAKKLEFPGERVPASSSTILAPSGEPDERAFPPVGTPPPPPGPHEENGEVMGDVSQVGKL